MTCCAILHIMSDESTFPLVENVLKPVKSQTYSTVAQCWCVCVCARIVLCTDANLYFLQWVENARPKWSDALQLFFLMLHFIIGVSNHSHRAEFSCSTDMSKIVTRQMYLPALKALDVGWSSCLQVSSVSQLVRHSSAC